MTNDVRRSVESLVAATFVVAVLAGIALAVSRGLIVRDMERDQFYNVVKVVQDNSGPDGEVRYGVTVSDPDGRTQWQWLDGPVNILPAAGRPDMLLVDVGLRYTRSSNPVTAKRYDLHVRTMADIQVIAKPAKKKRDLPKRRQ